MSLSFYKTNGPMLYHIFKLFYLIISIIRYIPSHKSEIYCFFYISKSLFITSWFSPNRRPLFRSNCYTDEPIRTENILQEHKVSVTPNLLIPLVLTIEAVRDLNMFFVVIFIVKGTFLQGERYRTTSEISPESTCI